MTTDGAISPDGKLVAYGSDRADQNNLDIYVQQIDSGGIVRLTDNPADDHDPTFSPDSATVAFRSERGAGGIYEVSALGGDARQLIPGGEHPRFSPDGRFLMYSRGLAGFGAALFVQAVSGGSPVQVSRGCGYVNTAAVWSPDSLRVLFFGVCEGQEGPWLGSITGQAPLNVKNRDAFRKAQNLVSEGTDGAFDQWLANPPRLLLPLRDGDASFEAVLPITPDGEALRPVERLTFGPARTNRGSASAGGRRIVLSSFEQSSNVWRLAVNAAGQARGSPVPVTTGPAENVEPLLSRDGKKLAFVTVQSGISALQVTDLETGSQRTLARAREFNELMVLAFNPAGDHIAYSGLFGAKIIATSGALAETFSSDFIAWSPQDDLLAYENRAHSINIVDRVTSKSSAFLTDPDRNLWQFHFSDNGQWVTFNAVQGSRSSQIYTVPFRKALIPGDQWIPITDGSHWDDKPRFSPGGKLMFFTSDRDGYRCLWAQRLAPDMHPQGDPFAVYHFHSSRRSLGAVAISDLELGLAPGVIVFNQGERTGNIWLLDPQ